MAYKIGSHNIDHRKLKTATSDAVNSTLTASGAAATSIFTSPFDQPVVHGLVYWDFNDETKTLTFSMKTELSNKIGNKAKFDSYAETPWGAKCDEDNVEKVILLDKITLPYPQHWLPCRTSHYDWEKSEDYYTEYEGIENLDLSQAMNLDYMFERWTSIPVGMIENLNVSACRSMSHMFDNASFEWKEGTEVDLSGWDTSHVEDMSYMFFYCDGYHVRTPIRTENVKNFEGMFNGCWVRVYGVSEMNWNRGINFKSMFNGGTSLTVRTFPNVPNGKYFDYMFCDQPYWETEDKTLDLSNWDTSNMETTNGMFLSFMGPKIYVGAGWNTSKVKYGQSEEMFKYAVNLPNYSESLCDVSVAHIGGNGVLSTPPYEIYWAVQEEGTVLRFSKIELDGSAKGHFSNEEPKACPWEAHKSKIQNIIFDFKMDLSDQVGGPYYLKDYFNHMTELVAITPLNGFSFSSLNFTEALSGDLKLREVDCSCFCLAKDPDFNPWSGQVPTARILLKNMFYDCRALKKVVFPNIALELGGIDASSMCRQSGIEEVEFGENYFLVNCENMFASSLAENIRFKYPIPYDLERLAGYLNFSYMFYNAKAVKEIDLTEALIFLDGWDWEHGGQVYHKLQYLFAGCSALKEIYVMDGDYWAYYLSRGDDANHMFEGCISLRNYDSAQDPNTDYRHCHPNCDRWDEEDYDYRNYRGYLYAVDNPPSDYNYWKVEDGVLYLSTKTAYDPEQKIYKYSQFSEDNLPPWSGNTSITKIVIESLKFQALAYLFYNMPNVTVIEGLSLFKFTSDLYSYTSAEHAFDGCTSLKEVRMEACDDNDWTSPLSEHPLSSLRYMFKNCENLVTVAIEGICVYGSTDEYCLVGVFYNCKKLKNVGQYMWDNWGCTNLAIDYMFFGCESIESINILVIDGAPRAYRTFEGCSKLYYIGAVPEEWTIPGDSTNMFRLCKSLPNFDSNYLNKEKAHRREGGYLSEM